METSLPSGLEECTGDTSASSLSVLHLWVFCDGSCLKSWSEEWVKYIDQHIIE